MDQKRVKLAVHLNLHGLSMVAIPAAVVKCSPDRSTGPETQNKAQ